MNHRRFRERYGPWALVAGASEGLGAAFVEDLARRGLNVVAVARRQSVLESHADKVMAVHPDVEIRPVVADLAEASAAGTLARTTADLDLGLLVYNAAVSLTGTFMEYSAEDHAATVAVNCHTQAMLVHHVAGRLRERAGGGMLLMSSLAGLQGTPYVAHYAATKAYARVLAEAVGKELRPQGIDIEACVAGAIATPAYLGAGGSTRVSPVVMRPETVARRSLDHLHRGGVYVPGAVNKLAAVLLTRLLPRRMAVGMLARSTRQLQRSR